MPPNCRRFLGTSVCLLHLTMRMLRGDYRPRRWTRSVWARFALAFSPLMVAALLAFVLAR
jgi:hypothetical protein